MPTSFLETLTHLSRKDWFPVVPIACAMALLGLLHLLPVIDYSFGLYQHLLKPGSVRQDLIAANLTDTSQLLIGVFMLLISIGLWLRSRTAWLLSMLVAVLGVINLFLFGKTLGDTGLLVYDIVLIGVMLASYRFFDKSSMRNGTMIALFSVVVLLGYAVLGIYHLGDQFSPKIDTIPEAVYVAVVTISTVGYGDFSPATQEARFFIVFLLTLTITVFSTAVGATLIPAIINKFQQITLGGHRKMIRNDHYIIVGYSSLSSNTYRELTNRKQSVTVILRNPQEDAQFPGTDVDIVIGDGSDLETLREAGAEKAKAILALLDDDSENAFVILAAKELNVNARTVAAVNDAKHLIRIRRVHPDMIIAPQVLGGELLTSMLTGERIEITSIMDRILGHSSGKADSQKH